MNILLINPRKGLVSCFYRKIIALYYLIKNNFENLEIDIERNCKGLNLTKYQRIITFTPFFQKNLNEFHKDYQNNNKKKIILIQTEHMLENRIWYKSIIKNSILIHSILDFSTNNINLLKKKIKNIQIYKFLLSYTPINELVFQNKLKIVGYNNLPKLNYNIQQSSLNIINKDIDVLFYGNKSKRRLEIHNLLLKNNINSVFIQSMKNINMMNNYLSRSKIVPIIHTFDNNRQHKHLDFYRITYQISNKIFTIHEKPFDNEIDDDDKNNIIFFDYDNVIQIIKHCLSFSNQKINELTENTYTWFKNKYKLDNQNNLTIFNSLLKNCLIE